MRGSGLRLDFNKKGMSRREKAPHGTGVVEKSKSYLEKLFSRGDEHSHPSSSPPDAILNGEIAGEEGSREVTNSASSPRKVAALETSSTSSTVSGSAPSPGTRRKGKEKDRSGKTSPRNADDDDEQEEKESNPSEKRKSHPLELLASKEEEETSKGKGSKLATSPPKSLLQTSSSRSTIRRSSLTVTEETQSQIGEASTTHEAKTSSGKDRKWSISILDKVFSRKDDHQSPPVSPPSSLIVSGTDQDEAPVDIVIGGGKKEEGSGYVTFMIGGTSSSNSSGRHMDDLDHHQKLSRKSLLGKMFSSLSSIPHTRDNIASDSHQERDPSSSPLSSSPPSSTSVAVEGKRRSLGAHPTSSLSSEGESSAPRGKGLQKVFSRGVERMLDLQSLEERLSRETPQPQTHSQANRRNSRQLTSPASRTRSPTSRSPTSLQSPATSPRSPSSHQSPTTSPRSNPTSPHGEFDGDRKERRKSYLTAMFSRSNLEKMLETGDLEVVEERAVSPPKSPQLSPPKTPSITPPRSPASSPPTKSPANSPPRSRPLSAVIASAQMAAHEDRRGSKVARTSPTTSPIRSRSPTTSPNRSPRRRRERSHTDGAQRGKTLEKVFSRGTLEKMLIDTRFEDDNRNGLPPPPPTSPIPPRNIFTSVSSSTIAARSPSEIEPSANSSVAVSPSNDSAIHSVVTPESEVPKPLTESLSPQLAGVVASTSLSTALAEEPSSVYFNPQDPRRYSLEKEKRKSFLAKVFSRGNLEKMAAEEGFSPVVSPVVSPRTNTPSVVLGTSPPGVVLSSSSSPVATTSSLIGSPGVFPTSEFGTSPPTLGVSLSCGNLGAAQQAYDAELREKRKSYLAKVFSRGTLDKMLEQAELDFIVEANFARERERSMSLSPPFSPPNSVVSSPLVTSPVQSPRIERVFSRGSAGFSAGGLSSSQGSVPTEAMVVGSLSSHDSSPRYRGTPALSPQAVRDSISPETSPRSAATANSKRGLFHLRVRKGSDAREDDGDKEQRLGKKKGKKKEKENRETSQENNAVVSSSSFPSSSSNPNKERELQQEKDKEKDKDKDKSTKKSKKKRSHWNSTL